MRKSRVIRCGQKSKGAEKLKAELECLQGFWSLEEQLGIRKKPGDELLKAIPQVTLEKGDRDG